jgi:cytochrome oxidase Cu insertion factor (SCO1/SenC/PrrC family)
MMRTMIVVFGGMLLTAGIVFAVNVRSEDMPAEASIVLGGGSRYAGVRQLPAYPIPQVELVSTDGAAFYLPAEARGRLLMLYIGYTNCPDACPLQMAKPHQRPGVAPPSTSAADIEKLLKDGRLRD